MFFDGSFAFFGFSAGLFPRCSADFRGADERRQSEAIAAAKEHGRAG
jgi:hypothetical protein